MRKNHPQKIVLDPDGNPEHYQNAIIGSLFHNQDFLKVLAESNYNFSSYFAQKTNKTNQNTDKRHKKNTASVAEAIIMWEQ